MAVFVSMRRVNPHHEISTLLLWICIHAIAVYLLRTGVARAGISDAVMSIVLIGIGLTIISRIVHVILYKKQFLIGLGLIKALITHTLSYWLMTFIVIRVGVVSPIISALVTGAGIAVLARVVRRTRFE